MNRIITSLIFIFLSQFTIAQITTTKIADKEEITTVLYDSTQNFLGTDVYNYVGQDLYLSGKSESLRKYGYEGFSKDYRVSTLSNSSNVYKCCDGFNSKYDELAGKYFKVVAINKHPKADDNEYLYGTKYYLELIEKESGDKVYYEYDSKYEYLFPFIVVGFFEKEKNRLVGEKFVFCNKTLETTTDIETGKPITKTPGQKWECIDFTIEEKYYSLSMILKNSLNEKITVSHDYSFNEYSKGRVYFAKDADYYQNKFGMTDWLKILDGKVVVGFTEEMVLLSWGKPEKINRASYGDQWVYDNQYLYFENGKLTSFN